MKVCNQKEELVLFDDLPVGAVFERTHPNTKGLIYKKVTNVDEVGNAVRLAGPGHDSGNRITLKLGDDKDCRVLNVTLVVHK